MRAIRPVLIFLVIGSLAAACGSTPPGASGTPTAGNTLAPSATAPSATATAGGIPTQAPNPTPTQAPVQTPAPTPTQPQPTDPPAGNNTITYEITGEYEASGVATFDEEASIYYEEGEYDIFREGWTAYFDNEAAGHRVRVVTRPDEFGVDFFGGEVVVVAHGHEGSDDECTFTLTKNDPTGPVGSAVCERAVVHPNGSTYVHLSIEWEVNL